MSKPVQLNWWVDRGTNVALVIFSLRRFNGLSGAVTFVVITYMLSEMHPMGNINHDASRGAICTNTVTSVSNQSGGSGACFGSLWAVQAGKLSVPAGVCTIMYVTVEITFESNPAENITLEEEREKDTKCT